MLFGLQCEVIIYIFAANKKQNDDTMKKRVVKNVMMLSVALLLAGCDLSDPFNNNNNDSGKHRVIAPVVFTAEEDAVADASNDFGLRFFKAVDSPMPKGANYVISPYSAQVALAMTLNGAADSTFKQIRDVLGYNGMEIEEINSYNKKLIEGLDFVAEDVRVKLANSLWLNKRLSSEIKPEFSLALIENYNAKAEALDFSSSGALKYINRWCSSQTNSLIDNAVNHLDPNGMLMLINAVYFKAEWQKPFEKKNNFKDYFHSDVSGKQEVEFMKSVFHAGYYENEKFEITYKDYGKTKKYSFFVVLPREDVTTEECLAELDADVWDKVGERFAEVTFTIPKFKVENGSSVIPALSLMGLSEPFTGKADFSNLVSGTPVCITDITQGNVFQINEKGTEAASVTKVEIGFTSPEGEPVDFTVNRPFLFFVKEKATNTILYAGKISSIE